MSTSPNDEGDSDANAESKADRIARTAHHDERRRSPEMISCELSVGFSGIDVTT